MVDGVNAINSIWFWWLSLKHVPIAWHGMCCVVASLLHVVFFVRRRLILLAVKANNAHLVNCHHLRDLGKNFRNAFATTSLSRKQTKQSSIDQWWLNTKYYLFCLQNVMWIRNIDEWNAPASAMTDERDYPQSFQRSSIACVVCVFCHIIFPNQIRCRTNSFLLMRFQLSLSR